MARNDTLARVLGMLIFLFGIGVLIFVFIMAYNMFTSPSHGLMIAPSEGKGPSATQNLGSSALIMLLRLALLFIMALVGSLIAGRGIQLYFTAEPENIERA